MIRKNGLFLFLGFLIIAFIVLAIEAKLYPANWAGALTTHTLVQQDTSHLELLWVQTVFTDNGYSRRQLAATEGNVFFIGSLSQRGASGLVALDGETGHKRWRVSDSETVDVGPEMVYVNYRNSIVAYSLTGEKVWQTRLFRARHISYFNAVDGKLYVDTGGYYILDALTGELLDNPTYLNPEMAIYYGNTAVFMGQHVFRGGENIHESLAVAINRQTRDILWRTENNVISNVAATESLAFVITYEDELLIMDAKTGKLLERIQIEPSINFFVRETQPYTRVYQLAVDQATQTLYVLLGDSNQLFAFRIHE